MQKWVTTIEVSPGNFEHPVFQIHIPTNGGNENIEYNVFEQDGHIYITAISNSCNGGYKMSFKSMLCKWVYTPLGQPGGIYVDKTESIKLLYTRIHDGLVDSLFLITPKQSYLTNDYSR